MPVVGPAVQRRGNPPFVCLKTAIQLFWKTPPCNRLSRGGVTAILLISKLPHAIGIQQPFPAIRAILKTEPHAIHLMRRMRRKWHFCASNPHCLSRFPISPAGSEKFSSKSAEHSLGGLLKC